MIKSTVNFLASSFLKTSDALSTVSEKLTEYSGLLTPEGLTDEYWKTLDSISQWNKPVDGYFWDYSFCVTRYYHLEEEQLVKLYALAAVTNNESEAMQMLFREEYEESISYKFAKLFQLPAHLLTLGSVVTGYSAYIPYSIGKGLEYGASAIDSLNTVKDSAEHTYEETSLIPELNLSYDSAAIAATLAISLL